MSPLFKNILVLFSLGSSVASSAQSAAGFGSGSSHAPDNGSLVYTNPVILSHYPVNDLQACPPEKLNAIYYYYTKSFILQKTCNTCDSTQYLHFDVTVYESMREQSTRYVRDFDKYGFKMILLSKDELLYPPLR